MKETIFKHEKKQMQKTMNAKKHRYYEKRKTVFDMAQAQVYSIYAKA
jgi:prophage maintenance system killer protein